MGERVERVEPVESVASVGRTRKKRAKGLPRRGKQPYPDAMRREIISVRIWPKTKQALESIGADNLGRAIDALVAFCGPEFLSRIGADAHSDIPVTRI